MTLVSNDPEEKLALSFSLAQSAKLFVFEVSGRRQLHLVSGQFRLHGQANFNHRDGGLGQRLASEVASVCVWTPGCLVQDRVDNFITNTKDIPMELATEGVIKLSRTEISKLTGMKEAVEEKEQ